MHSNFLCGRLDKVLPTLDNPWYFALPRKNSRPISHSCDAVRKSWSVGLLSPEIATAEQAAGVIPPESSAGVINF